MRYRETADMCTRGVWLVNLGVIQRQKDTRGLPVGALVVAEIERRGPELVPYVVVEKSVAL